MKKFSLFTHILAIVALFCVPTSCSQETTEDAGIVGNYSQITVGLPTTRTYLGEKVGKSYPTYWSESDAIVVNGAVSTSTTINENKTSATFGFANVVLQTPYYITYPYTEGSACAEGRPTVVFKSEQNYVVNTFDVGNAPMYGYFDGGDNIALQHLAGVMRLSITGSHTIATIEITAPEDTALAGEFDVDCQTGAISPIEGKTTNKITYTANETLSTDEAKNFFITIPTGNLGACEVVVTEKGGLSMKLQWNATDVKPGIVREFTAFPFKAGASFGLGSFTTEEDEFITGTPTYNENIFIYYTNGSTTEPTLPSATDVFDVNIVSNTYNAEKECWEIMFDGEVTSIGEGAFEGCNSLISVTIPDSVTEIGELPFNGCDNLTAFYGKYASEDNRCLIVDGVLTSFASAELTEYIIPDGVTVVGYRVFCECSNLTSVTIPDSVTEIRNEAFSGCTSLTSVTMPDGLTTLGVNPFKNCSNLSSFYGKFASEDNKCLIADGVLNSFAIGCGATKYTTPDGVTTIGHSAFYGCGSLTNVTIHGSVTKIGHAAFGDCTSLKRVFCEAITPPTAILHDTPSWEAFSNNAAERTIYAPISSLEAYRAAEHWSAYADYIDGYLTTTLPEAGEDTGTEENVE